MIFSQPVLRRVSACVYSRASVPVRVVPRLNPGQLAALPVACSRGFASWTAGEATPLPEIQKAVTKIIDTHPGRFGDLETPKGVAFEDFSFLIEQCAPAMSEWERKSLFISMDTSCDGFIQSGELLSDTVLGVIRSRFDQQEALHPVSGSYASLPNPPFHRDERQWKAVEKLSEVFDNCVSDFESGTVRTTAKKEARSPKKRISQTTGSGFFSSLSRRTKKEDKVEKVEPTVYVVPDYQSHKGLYLFGRSGAGKTVLLNVFFRALPPDFPVVRLHWHEFVRDAFRYMHELTKVAQKKGVPVFEVIAERIAGYCRVFLLDEILITHISEAILVKNLFRAMWMQGITIITTSNYKQEDLYTDGFNRDAFLDFIPELQERCPLMDMTTDVDYRRVSVESSNNFLFGFTPENTATMQAAWDKLVKESKANAEVTIPVENRNIEVPLAGVDNACARFGFDDICMKPMGRTDYALLATQFHTIFIDNVPKLSADRGVEFKRFVSLIDIMYDKKVNVFMNSEVPVEEIYSVPDDIHVDERFAWTRCLSMLIEMQTTKYQNMTWLMRNHLVQGNATTF